MRITHSAAVVTLLLLVPASALAQSSSPGANAAPIDAAAARAWCEAKGGEVEEREAYYGTNNDQSQWIDLGRSIELCRFVSDDESRIYVDTLTLATPTPTLASAAYLAKFQDPDLDPAKGDPAAQQCTHMGGTSSFGSGASGGGWVSLDDPIFQVVDLCMFADGSAIDEWGITYYSAGTVRGADLAPLFGWSGPDAGPAIFG